VRMPMKRPNTFIGAGDCPVGGAAVAIFSCVERSAAQATCLWDEQLYRTYQYDHFRVDVSGLS
jgi:hypothetical protein